MLKPLEMKELGQEKHDPSTHKIISSRDLWNETKNKERQMSAFSFQQTLKNNSLSISHKNLEKAHVRSDSRNQDMYQESLNSSGRDGRQFSFMVNVNKHEISKNINDCDKHLSDPDFGHH